MLHVTEAAIQTTIGIQFVMSASFYNLAVIHDQYEVRMADGGKTVSYRKYGTVFHQIRERILHKSLRNRIKRTGRLVKY